MQSVNERLIITELIILSVMDIRWKKIPIKVLLVFSVIDIGIQVYLGDMNLWLTICGAGIGIIFFIISKKTNESIGYADSWMILLLGICMGFWGIVGTLTGSMFVLAIVSLGIFVLKPKSRKLVLPFFPFLTVGYIFWVIAEI